MTKLIVYKCLKALVNMKKTFLSILIILIFSGILLSQNQQNLPRPPEQSGFKISYYKIWKENDDRTDVFTQQIQPNNITKSLHFRIIRDRNNRLISVAYYYKKLKIAPYVNDDGIWFHFIKYYYDNKNRLTRKTFYRETGEPQAQYLFEYNDQGQIIKVERQDYNLNPYREKEYKPKYFVLFDYYPNKKLRIMARYDSFTNPEEKFLYDNAGRLIRYERFYANSKNIHYYIVFKYNGQNRVVSQMVYNIDGVLVEIPRVEAQRRYEDLLRTRYPRPGRRGLNEPEAQLPRGRTEQPQNTAPQQGQPNRPNPNRRTPERINRNSNYGPGNPPPPTRARISAG